jgi:agmatinase
MLSTVLAENTPVDWAIYGAPYDGGVTFRPGTRFGPRAVRDASQYIKPFHLDHGVNVAETLSIADAGDAPVRPYDTKETLDLVVEFARQVGKPDHTKLLAVGGDHSIAYSNIRATWERRGKPAGGLALVHFDSHLDTVDTVWGEKWGHASPFIRAIEDGLIDPSKMISIGIKGPLNTAKDLDFAASRGVTIITHERWRREGLEPIRSHIARLGSHPAYITFDVDCVDPAFAPGTGTPCAGGFTSAEAFSLLRALRGINLVGGDVVEVLPDRDVSQITALLAAHILFEIVALDAAK